MYGTRSTPGLRHLKRYSTSAAGYWCSTTCIIENLYRSVSSSEWMIIERSGGKEDGERRHYPCRPSTRANTRT